MSNEINSLLNALTPAQEDILNKSYDWLAAVAQRQQRWLSNEDLWAAYPFKKNGLTKDGLIILIRQMQSKTV